MARILVPHCRHDDSFPFIDCFYCSDCEWSHTLPSPMQRDQFKHELCYADVSAACRQFEQHRCEDFQKRPKNGTHDS